MRHSEINKMICGVGIARALATEFGSCDLKTTQDPEQEVEEMG